MDPGSPNELPCLSLLSHHQRPENRKSSQSYPEGALKIGLNVAEQLLESVHKVGLGSEMRQQTWLRDIASFREQKLPQVVIALCGATGVGKSSLINAILDDDIVPTSGMKACTSVVVEISYNPENCINSTIEFLTRQDWEHELSSLLSVIAKFDPSEPFSISATQKIQDVYPSLSRDQLKELTAQEIIDTDPETASYLNKTMTISESDSAAFAPKIKKYIQSTNADDPYRGDSHLQEPSMSPLIRVVKIQCHAAALATGAVLVDLPGVADTNLARAAIATEYMQTCKFIWVVAPITRAAHDKTAQDLFGEAFKTQLKLDGSYSAASISFIATKTEDVSVKEITEELRLDLKPAYRNIMDDLVAISATISEHEYKLRQCEDAIRVLDVQIGQLDASEVELEKQRKAEKKNRKRKRSDTAGTRSPKRMRQGDDSTNGFSTDVVPETSESSESDSDDDDDDNEPIVESTLDGQPRASPAARNFIIKELEKVRKERRKLNKKRQRIQDELQEYSADLAYSRREYVAKDKEKKAYCSLERSKVCAEQLRVQFRQGMKDFEDDDANEDSDHNTSSEKETRELDVRVFTVSSRDYVRITKPSSDGEPTCFSNVDDTEIPALRTWCHGLTDIVREPVARSFLGRERAFMDGAVAYMSDLEAVDAADRDMLQSMWQSSAQYERTTSSTDSGETSQSPTSMAILGSSLSESDEASETSETSETSTPVEEPRLGIAAQLRIDLKQVVASSKRLLTDRFRRELADTFRTAGEKAKATGPVKAEEFCDELHWKTLRAVIVRDGHFTRDPRRGEFTRDLNADLAHLILDEISTSWSHLFNSDLFQEFRASVVRAIEDLLERVEDSTPAGLKERAEHQRRIIMKDTELILGGAIALAKALISQEQKGASRSITSHVKIKMLGGYNAAMDINGANAKKRQKKAIADYITENGEAIFFVGDMILQRLCEAVYEAADELTERVVKRIPQKTEVSMSVLWESSELGPAEKTDRMEFRQKLKTLQKELDVWLEEKEAPVDDAETESQMETSP
ncbi:hypothetical protein SISSUDRAFT_1051925 [Sistotremastrum suecicum HHB10207 ss-3]|uniref:G domain-containing protein n=1 Tax=Sistotremastrum suecicum HHB10207 ss-3 TaxID=1314776 RepID=A0A166A919_9AGAM|nr:hypothetical protein SISSUDRAFT_1051925 [Sistotremastrum suecicum HHB10207 ss-3]